MLDRLIDIAVQKRWLTLLLSLAFAAFGIVTFTKLKVEAFPDVTNVQVMVITLFPGQAAEEVERKVTIPVERALTGAPRVLVQRSITSFGLSQVILTFEDGVDIYWARQQVSERLPAAEVPSGIEPRLGPNDTPVGQVFQYTLESDRHSPSELRSWQEWVVSKQLMRAPGVADVVSFGGFLKEYHVLADAARLRNTGLRLQDVIDAVASSNGATSGGYLRYGESELVVRARGYLSSPADVENVVVRATGGTPILIRNIATVVESYTPRRGAVARGGAIDSVEGTVLLRRGENPKDVLAAVHEAVARINHDVLPEGMKIVPFYDRTRLVDTTLHTVSHNMIEGALLVTLVLWLFLRTIAASLAVAVTMPLALLTAFMGLHLVGVPANLLSMGAIDFGILLDGAVILVENTYRHLAEEQPPPERVPETVARAAKEVVRPTLFSMSIIGAAMMPIFTLERVEGRIFRPVALTYAFAVLGALLFTITCVPALTAALFQHRRIREKEPVFLVWLRARYLAGLRAVLRRPLVTCTAGFFVLAAAIVLIPRLGTEFLPEMNEGDIHITVTMPSAVALDRGSEILRDMRETLLQFPEVKDVLTEQGHPEDGTDDEAPNQAETFVIMKPETEWHTGRSKEQVVEAMRARLERRPGVRYNFSQPIKDRVEESISGIRGQIVVKIYGDDLGLMQARLEDVRRALVATRGARDVEIYRAGSAQHVIADVDREATSRLGVPVKDVEDAIESSLAGRVATEIWEGERKIGVRVKLPTPDHGDAYAMGRLEVPVGDRGARVPLSSLARVHVDVGRTQINREQGGRFLAIKCNIAGRDMGSFVGEAQSRVARDVKLPEGYYLTWGGEFENQRRAMKRLEVIVPISIVVIFFLLYMTFGAVLPAIVVLLDVPFATVGGVFALLATHTKLSVSAAVGFITLFGVAVMDGVLLVIYLRQAQTRTPDNQEAIVSAVSQRLRPVLMTALLASLGLLPAAMSHAIGSDTQRPFAIVIIGGLISSTLLTVLLLPTLYQLADHWFGEGRRRRRGRGVAALMAALLVLIPATAQAQPAEALTMPEAVRLALQRNRDAIAARLEIDAAQLDVVAARVYPNPVLSYAANNLVLGGGNPQTGGAAAAVPAHPGLLGQPVQTVGISEVLDVWSKRGARVRVAERGVERQRLLTEDALREIVHAVRSAFTEVVREQTERDLAHEMADRYAETVRLSRSRFKAGEISESELRKVELEGLRYRNDLIDADAQLDLTRQQLAVLLALPSASGLPPQLEAPPVSPTLDGTALKATALERRPDLRAAGAARGLAEAELDAARREALPDVTVGLGYTHSGFTIAGDNPNTLGLSLSVPVPIFDRNQAAVGRARLDARRAENDGARLRLTVEHEVEGAVRIALRAQAMIELFEGTPAGEEGQGMLARADKALHVAEASYRAGAISLLELLEAQRTSLDTRARYLRALHEARQAAVEIAYFVGE